MKTPEQILTEHALGEIPFNTGKSGVLYVVLSPANFQQLAYHIKLLSYDADNVFEPTSEAFTQLIDLRNEFSQLHIAMDNLQWTAVQKRAWLDLFCKPDNLAYYESKEELRTALQWVYVRAVQATFKKCEVPSPSAWITQSKIAAAREIAEFEKMVG